MPADRGGRPEIRGRRELQNLPPYGLARSRNRWPRQRGSRAPERPERRYSPGVREQDQLHARPVMCVKRVIMGCAESVLGGHEALRGWPGQFYVREAHAPNRGRDMAAPANDLHHGLNPNCADSRVPDWPRRSGRAAAALPQAGFGLRATQPRHQHLADEPGGRDVLDR